jgi:hypothetical protein
MILGVFTLIGYFPLKGIIFIFEVQLFILYFLIMPQMNPSYDAANIILMH